MPHVYDTQPLTPHAIEEWSHDVFQVGQHVRTFATEDGEWCYGQIDFHDEKQQQLGIRWYFNDTVTIMPISDFWDMEGEVIETVPCHLFTAYFFLFSSGISLEARGALHDNGASPARTLLFSKTNVVALAELL